MEFPDNPETLRSVACRDRDGDISVSTITVPKLSVIPNNIVEKCNKSEPKKQSKINEMIDFFNQPPYMKKELPSLQLRENSTNLERDSRFKYRRLVHMGYKMISNLFDV